MALLIILAAFVISLCLAWCLWLRLRHCSRMSWSFSGFPLAVPPNFFKAPRHAWRSSHHRRRSSFFATIGHIAPSANRLRARGEARGIGLGLVFRGSSRAELDRGREGRRSDQKHQGQSKHISCRQLFICICAPILDSKRATKINWRKQAWWRTTTGHRCGAARSVEVGRRSQEL